MDQDEPQTNVNLTHSSQQQQQQQQQWNPSTPSPTVDNSGSNQQQQPEPRSIPPKDNIGRTLSTLVSFRSWSSSTSVDSRTPEEKATDGLFDQIEDLIVDYMREPQRHHFDCRILRCSTSEDRPRFFNAVVVINPPSPEI